MQEFYHIKSINSLLKYAEDYNNKLKEMLKSFLTLGSLNEIDSFITEVQEKYPDSWKHKLFDNIGAGNTVFNTALSTQNEDIINKILELDPPITKFEIINAIRYNLSLETIQKILDSAKTIFVRNMNIEDFNSLILAIVKGGYFETIPTILSYTSDYMVSEVIVSILLVSIIEEKYEAIDYVITSPRFTPYLASENDKIHSMMSVCIKRNRLDILKKLCDAGIEAPPQLIINLKDNAYYNDKYQPVISLFKEYPSMASYF